MNSVDNVWNIITKKEIGNQMPCLKEEMWKRAGEARYSVAPTIMEELYKENGYLIKQRDVQRTLIL